MFLEISESQASVLEGSIFLRESLDTGHTLEQAEGLLSEALKELGDVNVEEILEGFDFDAAEPISESAGVSPAQVKGIAREEYAKEKKMNARVMKRIFDRCVEAAKMDGHNIGKGFLLTLIAIVINTSAMILLTVYLPQKYHGLAPFIVSVGVAPVVEEMLKRVSIEMDADKEFMVVFNAMEFAMYYKQIRAAGVSRGKTVALRGPAVAMHYATYAVQKKMGGGSGTEEGQSKVKSIARKIAGLAAGIAIHAIYNFLGLIAGEKINAWAMKK